MSVNSRPESNIAMHDEKMFFRVIHPGYANQRLLFQVLPNVVLTICSPCLWNVPECRGGGGSFSLDMSTFITARRWCSLTAVERNWFSISNHFIPLYDPWIFKCNFMGHWCWKGFSASLPSYFFPLSDTYSLRTE